jgi:hypothetical protein
VSAVSGSGGARWLPWAAAVVDAFPLAGTDWDMHAESVDARLYSVQDWARSRAAVPPPEPPADPDALF